MHLLPFGESAIAVDVAGELIRHRHVEPYPDELGAVREGVFRAHMIRADGSLRDTVYFSVIASEWPAVQIQDL